MSSVLTPNYPPPPRKSKEEMIQDVSQKSGSSFLTPNYPPPKRKTKEEMIAENGVAGPEGPPFNWTFAGLAFVLMCVIFGVIIGVLVTRNNDLDTSDPPATEAPMSNATVSSNGTTTSTDSTIDLECDMMTMNFTASNLVLTMSVTSAISGLEVDYASAVLQKTYTALLKNELTQSLRSYCDPYCRKIDSIVVLSNELTTPEAAESRQSDDCDSTLVVTFGVEGTFVGCEETEFPGLFAPGRRQLVQVQPSNVRMNLNAPRFLAGHEEADEMCPSCPDDSETLGLPAPTVGSMSEVLSDFVTVLPAICELTDAQIVDL